MTDKQRQSAESKYLSVFYATGARIAPSDAAERLMRHGYVWTGEEVWVYDPDEARRRGQQVDYGKQP